MFLKGPKNPSPIRTVLKSLGAVAAMQVDGLAAEGGRVERLEAAEKYVDKKQIDLRGT
ncbi:hypothetical protein DY000_02061734 [Brassica cretica]|uniref:Uncharacterized protein n=1 Tax=Brassica cretica TaxID=69181 RepID=A0ABQ7ATJ7_BRACR|nr:hypothetical protein DY000_02061734 [Brassica cretica]